jgi:hypothetical protein
MNHLTKLTLVLASISAGSAIAEDVRYTEDGYRETRRIVRHPVTDVVHQDVPRTVYREHARTELQHVDRVYSVPVTEYRRESYWRGRWNPFTQPYLAERIVPYTRWESRKETVAMPITTRQLVAETQIDKVPVVQHRYIDEEIISRVPVTNSGTGSTLSSLPVSGTPVGGVAKLDNDPPRQGTESAWRPSTTVR